MSTHLLAVVIGIPLAWHLGLAAFAYYDAGRHGMDRRKWGLVALLVPLFGFFAYLFERGERDYDPAEDPYAGGGYNVHESLDEEAESEDVGSEEAESQGTDQRSRTREETDDRSRKRRRS